MRKYFFVAVAGAIFASACAGQGIVQSSSGSPPQAFGISSAGRQALHPDQFVGVKVPTRHSGPLGIVTGPDGNVWFTEFLKNKIGKLDANNHITEYKVPTLKSHPNHIIVGGDGNLWFTETIGNKVAKITTAGVITEYPLLRSKAGPGGMAVGPDGNVWFTESFRNRIAIVTPTGSFTESTVNNIAKITVGGTLTEFAVPTPDSEPHDISYGAGGFIWFTEYAGNNIAFQTTP